ncbi:MAG TPA: phytoene/squalene synthase family protein, partial [Ktedonobacteraceae bacterium]|nr:phytoene/squalene synthase family protein [Ktedonobacteraceae bacterium]
MATAYQQSWESILLPLAYDAEHQPLASPPLSMNDRGLLDRAYAYCDSITSSNSRTFYLATGLLPAAKRRAMRALYAFCRMSDDIVDCSESDAEKMLATWRRRALTPEPPSTDLVTIAWADTRFRYQIPQRYAEQLIDGVERDLCQKRYRTFEDMVRYAYGVASTVGLMSMHIIGFAGEQAIPYAIKLGIALQITNILRDIGEDWAIGRLYLPMDEMAAFGLSEADLDKGQVNNHWRSFLRFQIERNRRLYAEANPGIALLNKDGRFAVAAASDLYRVILCDIETHDYDVFN